MDKRKFNVIIEQDEDGMYIARVPEITGCHTQADNMNDLLSRIKEAIEVCLEADKEESSSPRFVGLQQVEL